MSYAFAKEIISKHRHPQGWVDVEFADGVSEHLIQQVLVNLPIWEIYRSMGMPVLKRHMHEFKVFSKSVCQSILSEVYGDIYLDLDERGLDEFTWRLWHCINYLDDFGTMELAEHHCGISIVDLVEIVQDPVIKPIISVDLDNKYGTNVIEQTISDAKEKLCKALGTRGLLKNEALLHWQQADILNANQLQQVLIALGLRTEVNDKVIPRPVKGSVVSGMQNIVDLAIESQAGRKAAIMNHKAIQTSQYWGRKMHLITAELLRAYMPDCGAHKTIRRTIRASFAKNYVGKFIILDDGSIIPLTSRNIKSFIDHEVNMITPGGCRHTDGVCMVCGGLLLRNLSVRGISEEYPKFLQGFEFKNSNGINIGINSASEVVSQVSQMILSTKHLIKTLSQLYVIPTQATDFLVRKEDGIHLTPEFKNVKEPWSVGILFDDFYGTQSDLLELTEDAALPEDRFSSISSILVKDPSGIMSEFPLIVDGQKPFLTMEFLLYMKEKYIDLVVDENVLWIPMQDIPTIPIFRAAIVNDSTYAYVLSVIKFLESNGLSKYKSFGQALDHFCDLVWSKVPKTNILHLEMILKAHMITDKDRWDIPIVEDLDHVIFGNTPDIIHNRTYSGQFSYEEHKKRFADPTMYTVSRVVGAFDRNYGLSYDWIR
jgi:hypothetical protein